MTATIFVKNNTVLLCSRYTSFQAFKLLLQYFPFPLLFFLVKPKFGNVDAIEVAKLLREAKSISNNVILISDEMYLQKKV